MRQHSESGFTMLEVIISISLLLVMSMAVATMMRANVDMRFALAEQALVTHRVSTAMNKISQDLQHAFIISGKDTLRNPGTRKNNGIFRVEVSSVNGDSLTLTTMTHMPMLANSAEADTTLVVYRLEDDKENLGRRNLMRGESKRIPDDLKEEPPMQLLASNIKALRIMSWRGDDWSKETWDTARGEWRNKIPPLVSVEIEAFESDTQFGGTSKDADQEPTIKYRTVVYVPSSFGLEELKPSTAGSIRWNIL